MAKFERDIVLANDDGKVYHITQDVLEKLEAVDLNSDKYASVKNLLQHGVSVAAMPTPPQTGPHPDALCYLLNLASLKQNTPYEKR